MQTTCKIEIWLNRRFHVKNASLTFCIEHTEAAVCVHAAVITLKAESRLLTVGPNRLGCCSLHFLIAA